jgi:para-nitrobenzyl esterase
MDSMWPADADGEQKRGTIAVRDGYVLPDVMYDVYKKGNQNDVPTLVGYNANDGGNLLERVLSPSEYVQSVRKKYGMLAQRVLELYPADTDAIAERSQRQLLRDNWFAWPVWTWARLQSRQGRAKAYLFHFSHREQEPTEAVHGSELPYVFGNLELLPRNVTEDDWRVSELMSTYWTNFARTGDPNGLGLPSWPVFSEDEQVVMDFGDDVASKKIEQKHRYALDLQHEHADVARRASYERMRS